MAGYAAAGVTRALVLLITWAACHAASIVVPPSNTSALEGTNATLSCIIEGAQTEAQVLQFYQVTPQTRILTYNSVSIYPDKYVIEDVYRLTVLNVTSSDTGVYRCVLGTHISEATLSVYSLPIWSTLSWADGSLEAPTGIELNLTCNTWMSRPPAALTWSKGGVDVTDDVTHSTSTEGYNGFGNSSSMLTVVLTRRDHFAPYECHVSLGEYHDVIYYVFRVQLDNAAGSLSGDMRYLLFLLSLAIYGIPNSLSLTSAIPGIKHS